MINRITQLFPLWAVLFSAAAMLAPSFFIALKPYIVPLLTVVMLAMGLTLTPRDFINVGKHKKAVMAGVILQFTVMPLVALLISTLMGFDADLTVGMVLVGCVAGGTSSNVMTYLAKGDVALSISMTAISTLLGVVLTPLLTAWLVGQTVSVPTLSMLTTLVKIVLIPVAAGVIFNAVAHQTVRKLEPALPLVSMFGIVMIIAIVVALNNTNIMAHGTIIAAAIIIHNSCGLAAGYWVCRLLGFDTKVCRTIAFEVGLQNSGLATALAMKFFTPAAAIPGTLFSVWHNISGSILAGYWSRKAQADTAVQQDSSQPDAATAKTL